MRRLYPINRFLFLVVFCAGAVLFDCARSVAQEEAPKERHGFETDIEMLPDPFSLPGMLKAVLKKMDDEAKKSRVNSLLKRKDEWEERVSDRKKSLTRSPELVVPPELPPVVVSGIIFSETRPQAIINGAVVTKGDFLPFETAGSGRAVVQDIGKGEVVIAFAGTTHVFTTEGRKKSDVIQSLPPLGDRQGGANFFK